MILILDYGLGNIGSIFNMLKRIGVSDIRVSAEPQDIHSATKIIFPGVGSFDLGMKTLAEKKLIPVLNEVVLEKQKPVLGICLGMQLLTKGSEEGVLPGLGWIDAQTKKFVFHDSSFKVPHMGWNYISVCRDNMLLNKNEKNRFYFVHSYYVECNDKNNITATANYGFDFACAVQQNNIFGVQFHPEKSHSFGIHLFEHFVNF